MNKRSWLKALSWEGLSNTATFGLAYLFFGHAWECLLFTVVIVALKIVGYYWHEKWWDQ